MQILKWFFFTLFFFQLSATTLDEANASYQEGMQGSTILVQEQAFNQALHLYAAAAAQTSAPSASLNQAIANCYFQLGEYAWSILYSFRALKLDPRNPDIMAHLQLAGSHLGLDPLLTPFSLWQKILLQSIASPGEVIGLAGALFMAAFLILSCFIWHPHPLLKKLSLLFSALTLLLLFNLLLSFYFSPIEGVLVVSTGYYRAPDMQQPQLTPNPLKAGTRLRIVAAERQGNWLKAADSNGLIGYVPAFTIRLI